MRFDALNCSEQAALSVCQCFFDSDRTHNPGSGKTTLLRAMAGLDGAPAPKIGVSLMLQRPEDQVVDSTVGEFVGDATAAERLGLDPEEHPLDLSAAKLRLAQAASVFAQGREVVLLDEADVGLDDSARAEFHAMLVEVLNEGRAVVMACHDPGFIREVGEYTLVKKHMLAERMTRRGR